MTSVSGSKVRVVPVAMLAAGLIVTAALCLWWRATSASDGAVVVLNDTALPGGRAVVARDSPDGQLRKDDEVISIAGRNLADWAADRIGGPPMQAGDSVLYEVLRGGELHRVTVVLRNVPVLESISRSVGAVTVQALLLFVSVYLFVRRPRDPAARAALISCSFVVLTMCSAGYFSLEALDVVSGQQFWRWYIGEITYAMMWAGILHFALAFPVVASRAKHRLFVTATYGLPLLLHGIELGVVSLIGTSTALEWLSVLGSPAKLSLYLYPLLIIGVLAHKYRTCHEELTRSRLRWLAASLGSAALLSLTLWIIPVELFGVVLLPYTVLPLVFLPVPLTVAAAVLRYRALDIEVVLSRSLVYAGLSACVAGGYVAVVGGLRALFPELTEMWEQAMAAALAAGLVLPLRNRLNKIVNQRLFGDRDDPYRVVSALSARLEQTQTPAAMLPTLVETVGQALRLPYAAIELQRGEASEAVASYGTPPEQTMALTRLALAYQGEPIGQLVVAPRGPNEGFNSSDLRVLADVARHAGAVAYTARLTSDLARSRSRLVQAREEERRRLLHDLHDGVGPTLAATALGLQAVRRIMVKDQPGAEQLLSRLEDELQAAIGEIRRVANGLRPPVLDQLGLATAIREHANTLAGRLRGPAAGGADRPLDIDVDIPGPLPALPAAVEVAAYRIISEALTNVARHANAGSCRVRIWLDDGAKDLCVEVVDDGAGLTAMQHNGVGLRSMRERANELGGECVVEPAESTGTRVAARLPLPIEES